MRSRPPNPRYRRARRWLDRPAQTASCAGRPAPGWALCARNRPALPTAPMRPSDTTETKAKRDGSYDPTPKSHDIAPNSGPPTGNAHLCQRDRVRGAKHGLMVRIWQRSALNLGLNCTEGAQLRRSADRCASGAGAQEPAEEGAQAGPARRPGEAAGRRSGLHGRAARRPAQTRVDVLGEGLAKALGEAAGKGGAAELGQEPGQRVADDHVTRSPRRWLLRKGRRAGTPRCPTRASPPCGRRPGPR